jgi:BirA family biotin operon repressor/biotin-[acetyl-CoA-carboxylase] ligase
MQVIKLDAIDSTNEFLKGLSNKQVLENFTVVTAEAQNKGKGQMGAVWASEPSKNLIMSVLIKDFLLDINTVFELNILVSLSIIDVLAESNVPKLSIKWPNDIMSDNKKIGGILIENSIKSDGSISSVVGLGLNVNQTNFENLPKASSLAVVSNAFFDKQELLIRIIERMELRILEWNKKSVSSWLEYVNQLFKKGIPMPFENQDGLQFMGIIQGVSPIGKLEILLENDSISRYDIKEIKMLY